MVVNVEPHQGRRQTRRPIRRQAHLPPLLLSSESDGVGGQQEHVVGWFCRLVRCPETGHKSPYEHDNQRNDDSPNNRNQHGTTSVAMLLATSTDMPLIFYAQRHDCW